ncbi:DUF4145 domain-containing protein [Microbispora sp. H10670]|uniref:DUF4145 domain-containing protein n=1 Tax=Microbispora sp. H10670 TaxID=2729108 RepID=UPI00160134B3|nr:DUF4145 domain-containing protein [Microbispora sp. H10670]
MADQLALMVGNSRNFRFLAEPALLLAGDAAAAELYVDSDPDAAMGKARRFGETLAKIIAQRAGINSRRVRGQAGRIDELANAGVIPDHIRQAFHTVRESGNEAVHDYSGDRQKAVSAVAACFELGAWWYRTETGKEVTHSFEAQAPASTSFRDMLSDIENQLSQLQAAFEANTQPKRNRLRVIGVAIGTVGMVAALVYSTGAFLRPFESKPAGNTSATQTPPFETPVAAVTSFAPVSCGDSGWVVVNRSSDQFPYSPDKAPADAVLSSGGRITVTVQGLNRRSVILQKMRVEVIRRSPAVSGTYLPLGCEGGMTPRHYVVDLDAAVPRVVPERDSAPFPYKVSEIEPEQFLITPEVGSGNVEFRLIIEWTSGDHQGELVLPESGKPPFRVTATTASRRFCMDPTLSMWRPSC